MNCGLFAAVERATRERYSLFGYCKGALDGLARLWREDFKVKRDFQQLTDMPFDESVAEIERTLVGKLSPCCQSFVQAFRHASAVVRSDPEDMPFDSMAAHCRAVERSLADLAGGLRVLRPAAQVNARRSQKANHARHKDARADEAHLRQWLRDWFAQHPDGTCAGAAEEAVKTRQIPGKYETVYRKVLSIRKEM